MTAFDAVTTAQATTQAGKTLISVSPLVPVLNRVRSVNASKASVLVDEVEAVTTAIKSRSADKTTFTVSTLTADLIIGVAAEKADISIDTLTASFVALGPAPDINYPTRVAIDDVTTFLDEVDVDTEAVLDDVHTIFKEEGLE